MYTVQKRRAAKISDYKMQNSYWENFCHVTAKHSKSIITSCC